MHKHILAIMSIAGLILAQTFIMPVSTGQAQTNQTEVFEASATWIHEGFKVQRFDLPLYPSDDGNNGYFSRLGNNIDGYQAVAISDNDRTDTHGRLAYLTENSDELIVTPYGLPSVGKCFYAATSQGCSKYPNTLEYQNGWLVRDQDQWYSYDPKTEAATLVFDGSDLEHELYYRKNATVVNGELCLFLAVAYVDEYNAKRMDLQTIHVLGPNEYEVVEGTGSNPVSETPIFSDLIYTDELPDGTTIGQNGAGVYVVRNGQRTKIGYSSKDLRNAWGILHETQGSPKGFGESSVVWQGSDQNLYVATLTADLPEMDLTDTPTATPFRTYSDSTVYLQFSSSSSGAIYAFENESDYLNFAEHTGKTTILYVSDELQPYLDEQEQTITRNEKWVKPSDDPEVGWSRWNNWI